MEDSNPKKYIEEYGLTLSINDVQEILGCNKNTVYKLIHSKGFPALQLEKNSKVFIPRDLFYEWYLNSSKQGLHSSYFEFSFMLGFRSIKNYSYYISFITHYKS